MKNYYLLIAILISTINNTLSSSKKQQRSQSQTIHSRQKRILWITEDGRLALPPGTHLVISPSLSLPFVRYPPDGFSSNMTVSLPFTIDFDKLGLTDNENPFGVIPTVLSRSMGRAAGSLLADYIASMLDWRRLRGKRSTTITLPDKHRDAFHGGERALLYLVVEEFLENFGMDGRACLLRAICEIHAHPMTNFGMFGEMIKLFFTASKSPFSYLLDEYVNAERAGTGKYGGPAECWPYMKDCPKSLFQSSKKHGNRYSEKETTSSTSSTNNNDGDDKTSTTTTDYHHDDNDDSIYNEIDPLSSSQQEQNHHNPNTMWVRNM